MHDVLSTEELIPEMVNESSNLCTIHYYAFLS